MSWERPSSCHPLHCSAAAGSQGAQRVPRALPGKAVQVVCYEFSSFSSQSLLPWLGEEAAVSSLLLIFWSILKPSVAAHSSLFCWCCILSWFSCSHISPAVLNAFCFLLGYSSCSALELATHLFRSALIQQNLRTRLPCTVMFLLCCYLLCRHQTLWPAACGAEPLLAGVSWETWLNSWGNVLWKCCICPLLVLGGGWSRLPS